MKLMAYTVLIGTVAVILMLCITVARNTSDFSKELSWFSQDVTIDGSIYVVEPNDDVVNIAVTSCSSFRLLVDDAVVTSSLVVLKPFAASMANKCTFTGSAESGAPRVYAFDVNSSKITQIEFLSSDSNTSLAIYAQEGDFKLSRTFTKSGQATRVLLWVGTSIAGVICVILGLAISLSLYDSKKS